LAGIRANPSPRSASLRLPRKAFTKSRALSPIACKKLPALSAALRSKSTERLRFFSFAWILQRFDLGKQTVPAEASHCIGRHRDVR
jgi:hypothetical protein